MIEKKLDRRRKYFLILDCETCTLPYASELSAEAKKSVAIAKPLIYDLGWTICDAKGNVYRRRNYLITEIFSVPAIFNTAYYASKTKPALQFGHSISSIHSSSSYSHGGISPAHFASNLHVG